MPTTQHFQFITLRGKIQVFKPSNPFAPGVVESLNSYPIELQLQVVSQILNVPNLQWHLTVLGLNHEYDIVLYQLDITT